MAWDDGAGSDAGCWSERIGSSSSSLNQQADESPLRGSRNEEEAMSGTTTMDSNITDEFTVKDVVYTWVLANHPEVIQMAKDMVSPDWETLTDAWQD